MDKNKWNRSLRAIAGAVVGKEASMYPHIRDLFVAIGHDPSDIETDSRQAGGGRPDVAVHVRQDNVELTAWVVVEAKDEPGTFRDDAKASIILKEKWRYVGSDTEWFIMVDPDTIRIRQVHCYEQVDQDTADVIVDTSDPEEAARAFEGISAEALDIRPRLQAFRAGDKRTFGRIDAGKRECQPMFLRDLKKAVFELAQGCRAALNGMSKERSLVRDALAQFRSKYPGVELIGTPLKARNAGSVNVSAQKAFRNDLRELKDLSCRHPEAFIIEFQLMPHYLGATRDHKGNANPEASDDLLIDETSALLLSRVVLLRFFEDYDYFGRRRYLCNGGVMAFQKMREVLNQKYPSLIRDAYEAATHVYPGVFETHPLDWVLHSDSDAFSSRLEHAMMLLAVYDFRTIKEELLSGVFGVFFNEQQRKRRGEHYTPPTIARWMIGRARHYHPTGKGKLLDPACGFGTFLVGGWIELFARDAERGIIPHKEIETNIGNICGNDLNHFSAVLSQMQLLWTIISARTPQARKSRLPFLNIASGISSLEFDDALITGREMLVTDWGMMSIDKYPFVVGNPPWVRSERNTDKLDDDQQGYFAEIGNPNIYAQFLYKALRQWVDDDGVVAFVVPVTIADSKECEKLRELFAPDTGSYHLLETVDFEVIKREAFPDANVRPLIIFARKGRAPHNHMVVTRMVDYGQVARFDGVGVASFDLDSAPSYSVDYRSLVAPNGAWRLRITENRNTLIKKLAGGKFFSDITFEAWNIKKGNTIVDRVTHKPDPLVLPHHQKADRAGYILRGAVKRGQSPVKGTYKVFKGENILPCQIEGHVEEGIDPSLSYSDPSLWRFPSVIPPSCVAFTRITQFLVAASFDPAKLASFDTVTLFAPRADLAKFPFDYLVNSTPYRWYHLVGAREGVIADYYCGVYPSTVANLPWSDNLIANEQQLISLRSEFLELCRCKFHALQETIKALHHAGAQTLRARMGDCPWMVIRWEGLHEGDCASDFTRIMKGPELMDSFLINDAVTAAEIKRVLALYPSEMLEDKTIMELPLPLDQSELHCKIIEDYKSADYQSVIEGNLQSLDKIVAESFRISQADLEFMVSDIRSDPLFRLMEPRLPFQPKTTRGLLQALADPDRYSH